MRVLQARDADEWVRLFYFRSDVVIEAMMLLLSALVIVFLAAQMFTNALEWIGERMGVSEGVTGSVFAAVGTAMPETIVPMVAVLGGGAAVEINHAVGMGAILGAPFMLGTLSLGMMAYFAGRLRGWTDAFKPELTGFRRDINFFLVGYSMAVAVAFLPPAWQIVRVLAALLLFIMYFLYLMATIRASQKLVTEGHATEAEHDLYGAKLFSASTLIASLQLLLALIALVWGARLFVAGAESMSELIGIAALVVSLLIVPVATELPEKVNSILWIRRRRDTLAFGNITGAMVFQGTIIPAIGMLIMPWHIDSSYAVASVALALSGVAWLWFLLKSERLTPVWLMGNAVLYGLFIVMVVVGGGR
ncbi:MAG TPA: sodium:calcium antiporter [Mariprofundaceae bacterium]|nr:sodium:calcium antiporter [Mariprofundaceae bacterium]